MRYSSICAFLALSSPAVAFEPIQDYDAFLAAIEGRSLGRMGIELRVQPEGSATGAISGQAFGRPVTGEWRWQDGYFCRTLGWGDRDLGFNCQAVLRDGETLRFVSDRGEGQMADFRLR